MCIGACRTSSANTAPVSDYWVALLVEQGSRRCVVHFRRASAGPAWAWYDGWYGYDVMENGQECESEVANGHVHTGVGVECDVDV